MMERAASDGARNDGVGRPEAEQPSPREGPLWVEPCGSIVISRTAGIGASFPFLLAPVEVG
jgi:hypothetical protein